ncbi:hypothetical protein [uncultured Brevundimonas sp.]|uniref:hypothetical protein n=1 Tax=uncultured Brevundimonas sp. TaxID=213418 RepID=UPI0025EC5CD2|nr:hypothetical protein [uncultured Brevundimonas sp.]
MGRPRHYSAEIPARCQALIEMLGTAVEEASDPNGRWGGPLKTTFLMAMATPMIALPIERIFKPARDNHEGVADDRELDPDLSGQVAHELGPARPFGSAPFFERGAWAYIPTIGPFNVAGDWPARALVPLRSAAAAEAAAEAPARVILLALRNALSHGGVTYLDRNGGHADYATHMLGFASLARARHPELRLLRVGVPEFETFLRLWANWLSSAGVIDQLERRGPGHFQFAAE